MHLFVGAALISLSPV